MKILVAVDLSEASARVVEAARRVATQSGADVYLLHVAEPNPDFVGFEAGPDVVRSQVAEEYRREHRAVQELAEHLREAGISATALLVQGPTVATTLEQAAETRCRPDRRRQPWPRRHLRCAGGQLQRRHSAQGQGAGAGGAHPQGLRA